MAFQQAGLFEWRTVAKNVELPLELQGWAKAKRRRPGDGDARAGEAGRLRRPPPVGAVGRHAAARRHRPRPRRRPAAAADGRAVRRPRRDDPRAHAGRAAPHLRRDRHHGRVRHALDPRGRVPVEPRRGDVAAAGPHHRRRSTSSSASATRTPARRPTFFKKITEVREALRGDRVQPRRRAGSARSMTLTACAPSWPPSCVGVVFLALWELFVDVARHQAVPAAEAVGHLGRRSPTTSARSGRRRGRRAPNALVGLIVPAPSLGVADGARGQPLPHRQRAGHAAGGGGQRHARSSPWRRSSTTCSRRTSAIPRRLVVTIIVFFPIFVNTLRGPRPGRRRPSRS